MRSSELELIDRELNDIREVEENLGEMEWMLKFIGIGRGIRRHFRTLRKISVRILDVGTGSAWISRMLRDDAARRGMKTRIVALDLSSVMLDCARRIDPQGLEYVLGDARQLEFESNSFDFTFCSAMLHHMSDAEARQVLREIDRVTSGTWVVCDLRRTGLTYFGAQVLTRLISTNRLTRNDGPLSVKRSFTFGEFQGLAREMQGVRAESWGPFCHALVCAKR